MIAYAIVNAGMNEIITESHRGNLNIFPYKYEASAYIRENSLSLDFEIKEVEIKIL